MSQLAIMVIVDVQAALAEGKLEGNTYLVDNNQEAGSTNEGTDSLETAVKGGMILNWLITGLGGPAQLRIICGEAVDRGVLVPQEFDSPSFVGEGLWWSGTVNTLLDARHEYTIVVTMGDRTMEIKSHLIMQPGMLKTEKMNEVKLGKEQMKSLNDLGLTNELRKAGLLVVEEDVTQFGEEVAEELRKK